MLKKLLLLFILLSFCALGEEITPNVQSRLVVDGLLKPVFQWVYYTAPKQVFYIEKEKFLKNLVDIIKPEVAKNIDNFPGRFVTSDQLAQMGIKAIFNESTLDVEVQIPFTLKLEQTINLTGRGYDKEEQEYIVRSDQFSSYLNTYLSQTFDDQDGGYGLSERKTNLEWVSYFKGFTLENSVNYSSQQEQKWQREKTILTYDFEKIMSRLQIGDITTQTVGRQRQFLSAGISFSRVFNINPKFFRTNIHTNQIILERPSNVEVFMNNVLVKQENLQPGPVDIRDFPFFSGENVVLIRITDDLGRVREEYFNDYYSAQLLREGISEYSVSLEAPRTSLSENDYQTDETYLTAFYRYGFTKNMMAGLYIQANQDEQLLGAESSFISPYGVIQGEMAGSRNSEISAQGIFGELNYSTLLFKTGNIAPYTISSLFQYRSSDFYRQTEDIGVPINVRYLFDMSVRQNDRSSLQSSFGIRKIYTNDQNHRTSYYINSGWNLNRNFQINFKASTSFRPTEESSILVSLYWTDNSGRNQVFSNFDPERESLSTRYQYNPTYQVDAFRISAGTNVTPEAYGIDGSVDYYHRRFQARIAQNSNLGRDNDVLVKNVNSTQLSASFSLAFAGGAIALSRPINNSFVIVDTDKKIKADKIYINKYFDFAQAQIDSWGPAVLSNITPYFNERVVLDNSTFPIGVSLSRDHYIARTGYKSGIFIKANIKGFSAIKGRILYPNKKPVSLEVGSIIKINPDFSRTEVSRFFTNELGEVFVEKLIEGDYKLELDNTALEAYSFKITDDQIGVIDLKDIELSRNQSVLENQ